MSRDELDSAIAAAIESVARRYSANPRGYLTESDLVVELASELKRRVRGWSLRVHCGLRPRWNDAVIRDGAWVRLQMERRGPFGHAIDVAIIDDSDEPWEKALEWVEGVKYWRVLSYPVEAFVAAIEVKVRVHNNLRRIRLDIESLRAMREANREGPEEVRKEDLSRS